MKKNAKLALICFSMCSLFAFTEAKAQEVITEEVYVEQAVEEKESFDDFWEVYYSYSTMDFNYDLIAKAAKNNPNYNFVLIGVNYQNALKKLGASLATIYAVVDSGKYEGCSIALGNAPKEKVSVANSFSQMIFLKEKEEMARLNIATDIEDVEYVETIQFPATGNDGYRCIITFTDGETCKADLFPSRLYVFCNNLKEKMRKDTIEFFKKAM